jgi:pimeloyl-ACP methyl ester carboxylesterase
VPPTRPSPPAVLETLAFAPFPVTDLPRLARVDLPGVRLVETASSYVRVRSAGHGRDAVVLSDGPNTVEHYDEVLDLLGRDMRIHVVEIPGFGFSWAKDPGALTLEGTVAAVCDALADVIDGPAVVAGLCVQAHVALLLAARFPHLCEGLVLAQATGWRQTRDWVSQVIDPGGVLSEPWQGQIAWRATRERAAVDHWYRQASAPGYDVAPWQAIARDVMRSGATYSLPTLMQTWYEGPCPFQTIDLPSVLLWGDADPTHVAAGSDPWALADHLVAPVRDTVRGGGHFLDLQSPDRLRAAIAAARP